MVRHALFLVLSLCFAVSVGASTSTGQLSKKRPVIKKLVIEKNGAWSDGVSSQETPADCADNFVLKASDVREFFKIARKATDIEYGHDLLMSRCYASGSVTLQDGRKAIWEIDRARRGVLWLSDDNAVYFYCGKCRNKAYMEDCDIDCINAP